MAFCTNCGHQLADGAKFCFECGAKVGGTAEPRVESRRMVYDGELHKCPNCGELLGSFSQVCPACGIELRGTKASDAVTLFTSKLEAAKTEDNRINVIRNFPIPNTKEDIWEIMVLASTNILGNQSLDLRRAWYAKFEQGYQKAQMMFTGDDLVKISSLYNETKKKIRSDDIIQGTKATGKAIGIIFGGVFSGLGYLLKKLPAILSVIMRNILAILCVVAYFKAIQIDRTGENGVGYELLGGILSIAAASLLFRKNVSYFDILIVGACGGMHFYLARFLENGAGLQLLGVITFVLVFIAFLKHVKASTAKKDNE